MITIATVRRSFNGISPISGGCRVIEVESVSALATALHRERISAIMLALRCGDAIPTELRQKINSGLSLPCPIVAQVATDHASYTQLIGLMKLTEVWPVLPIRPATESVPWLDRLQGTASASPSDYLLQATAGVIPESKASIVIPAIAIGAKRVGAGVLNSLIPMASRTMRTLLRRSSMPSPRRILAHVVGFGVTFNSRVCGMSLSRCAQWSGFETEDALRRYLRSGTALTPTAWARMGVAGATNLFVRRLHLADHSQEPLVLGQKSAGRAGLG